MHQRCQLSAPLTPAFGHARSSLVIAADVATPLRLPAASPLRAGAHLARGRNLGSRGRCVPVAVALARCAAGGALLGVPSALAGRAAAAPEAGCHVSDEGAPPSVATRTAPHAAPHARLRVQTRCTPAERTESLARVLSAIAAVHGAAGGDTLATPPCIERFLSDWHFGTPASSIGSRSLSRFLCRILFYVDSPHELDAVERHELDAAVAAVAAARRSRGEGDEASARSMRVCMPAEPLNWHHFPLFFYVGLAAIRLVGHTFFCLAGFQRHTVDRGTLTYYRRPATVAASSRLPPLVLLPGVGIGVSGYIPMLLTSLSRPDSDVFVVELSHVTAGQMQGCVPAEDAVVAAILAMLMAHSHKRARFMCHSYGTFVMAWLLREAAGRSVVHSLLLIDPVALLVAFPHVTHGAVYRRMLEHPLTEALWGSSREQQSRLAAAASSAQLLRRLGVTLYFMREAHIALVLQRHVHWPSHSLWLEDIPAACPVTVALSTRDALVPTREVASYVASDRRVRVLWLHAHEHGEVVYNAAHWGELARALAQQ